MVSEILISTSGDPMLDLMILQQAIATAGPEACYEVAQMIATEARGLVQVDGGALQGSIHAVRTSKGATVGFGGDEAYYGLFIEYGTRKLTGEGYKGKLPPLPGYNDDNGYPFMRPAIDNIVESGIAVNLIAGKIKNKWAEGKIWEKGFDMQFFELIMDHSLQGFYGSPRHGGNKNYISYKMINLDYPVIIGQNRYNV